MYNWCLFLTFQIADVQDFRDSFLVTVDNLDDIVIPDEPFSTIKKRPAPTPPKKQSNATVNPHIINTSFTATGNPRKTSNPASTINTNRSKFVESSNKQQRYDPFATKT